MNRLQRFVGLSAVGAMALALLVRSPKRIRHSGAPTHRRTRQLHPPKILERDRSLRHRSARRRELSRERQAPQPGDDVHRERHERPEERNHAPPPEKKADERHLEEVGVDARPAQLSADGAGKTNEDDADVLVKGHLLGGGARRASLAVVHSRSLGPGG